MKNMFLLMACCLLAFAAVAQRKPATVVTDNRLQDLDAQIEKVLADWSGAGLAIAIVEKGKTIYAKGYGVKDMKTRQPVTPNTLFAIGSCSKAFTSALVGQLATAGKLSYDEPVRTYLPDLQFYNNDMNNSITLRDMMSHKTGLPRHDLSWYFNQSANRDSLLMRIKYMEPTYKPREKYQYNNFMFFAQGMVVEKLTGKSWEANLQEKLLKPLGMTRSNSPYSTVKNDADLASPHAYKNDSTLELVPHYNIQGMGPAGGIYSSVTEMSNWLKAWIYGGKYAGMEVMPAAYVREAMSAQMHTGTGIPDSSHPDISGANYGFGWNMVSYRGHYRVEHGGAIDGFLASTAFFPLDSLGIVVLTNQDNRTIPAVVRNIIADRMLRLKQADWNQENLDRRKRDNAAAAKAKATATETRHAARMSHAPADYEGLYTHPGYGSYDVELRGDSLIMHTMYEDLWLQNWHYDVFRPYSIQAGQPVDTAVKSAITFRFNTSTTGEIESMQAYGFEAPGINLVFTKSPKPKALTASDLQAYTGTYELAGTLIKAYVKDGTLIIDVPGQPPYEQVPQGNHQFAFKTVSGYSVQFDAPVNGASQGVTIKQPNGNFKAVRKN